MTLKGVIQISIKFGR